MPKTLVLYYSKSGNNKYLANKIAGRLQCDIEEIKPKIGNLAYLVILNLLGLPSGIKKIDHDPAQYDQIVLCGPIWMGKLIPPMKTFLKKYKMTTKSLAVALCCGSSDEEKDGRFGYAQVFKKIKNMVDEKLKIAEAFSVHLMVSAEKKNDREALMKVSLNDETFKNIPKERFDRFIEKIS